MWLRKRSVRAPNRASGNDGTVCTDTRCAITESAMCYLSKVYTTYAGPVTCTHDLRAQFVFCSRRNFARFYQRDGGGGNRRRFRFDCRLNDEHGVFRSSGHTVDDNGCLSRRHRCPFTDSDLAFSNDIYTPPRITAGRGCYNRKKTE